MKKLFATGDHTTTVSIGLLLLRVVPGVMMLAAHGWPKLASFADNQGSFPDPLGIGSTLSLTFTVAAEVLAATFVVLGLATRPAAAGLAFTMAVAFFMVHGGDPFAKRELALLYLAAFVPLIFTGAGTFSLDRHLGR